MNPKPEETPHQCNIRQGLEAFAARQNPSPRIVIDPRVSEIFPCDPEDLESGLEGIALELAEVARPLLSLVAFEPDHSGLRLLRIEVPNTTHGFTLEPWCPPLTRPDLPAGSLRVLVVEDNLTNQNVAIQCLQVLGFEADVAKDGFAAVEAAAHTHYDLILMDIHMPGMDGLDATRIIRRLPDGRIPYIAALTAYTFPGDRIRALDSGMDDYIAKPCRIESLSHILHRALAKKI